MTVLNMQAVAFIGWKEKIYQHHSVNQSINHPAKDVVATSST